MCGPHIRFCLFTSRPIASKQLNSLTTIVVYVGKTAKRCIDWSSKYALS